MQNTNVLVVDDEQTVCDYVAHFLCSRGYVVDSASSGEAAIARLKRGQYPSLMILDLLLPGLTGLEILEYLKKTTSTIPVIILSSEGQTRTVVQAIKLGAADYLVKPFENEELELSVKAIMERQSLLKEISKLRQQLADNHQLDLVSCDPKVIKVKEIARQVADTSLPVIIVGESGVGKEVLAHSIHDLGARRDKPFIKVNCAALPEELLESELFGYERGAFTGAISDNPGKFELAHQGTILLDEIAEMSPHLQAKLLHVLQDGEFRRLGGKNIVRVDARVLAATNKRVEDLLASGKFREDLYFRLNVIKLEIPPLRDRQDDIPMLANYFLQKYRGLQDQTVERLPLELLGAFLRYSWPGNVRQLENAVRSYLILQDVSLVIERLNEASPQAARVPGSLNLLAYSSQAAEQAEKQIIARALDETGWNRKEAARRLHISYRALRGKLKKWQMEKTEKGMIHLQSGLILFTISLVPVYHLF
ncbi:MAG TPA: sigma-54 dependent transcriptional regulator [Blastocatellia bacterium]|jgi:two-component system response regulator AtoC|nr:sigma-54 dependent transcriptional regulator [Blastocatellia bacterium]